jgi:hypothetical protein
MIRHQDTKTQNTNPLDKNISRRERSGRREFQRALRALREIIELF